jgi:hypothetical protein
MKVVQRVVQPRYPGTDDIPLVAAWIEWQGWLRGLNGKEFEVIVFAAWVNITHAAVMTVMSVHLPNER